MSFITPGSGKGLPELSVTNSNLSELVDSSDECIITRTGIKSRYICTNEMMFDLSFKAAQDALENSGIKACELDLIICSTVQSDYVTPSLSCLIQGGLGANCPAFDINAACTGFIYALDVAAAYFDSGRARNILIVSSEIMSKHVDWTDRATCVLFGDGAGAVVLTKGNGLLSIKISSQGDDKLLTIGGSIGASPFAEKREESKFIKMQGSEVFKFAVTSMCRDINEVVEKAGLKIEDIKRVIPHQANLRIINSAAEKLKLREEQMVRGIYKYGNTSSASIPIMLSELFEINVLENGDITVLSAFGGGLTSGACAIEI